jgi:hypothetical protein
MNCQHCGATTNNGLGLCELCRYGASKRFEVLPVYFRNLARWRPGRAGSRPVPGSRVLYDGESRSSDSTGDRISDRLNEALAALSTWGRALVDDRGTFERPLTFADAALVDDLPEEIADDKALVFTWLCLGLEHHLVSIATLEWAGEMMRDLGHHEGRLRALIDLVPGWYAGACRRRITMDSVCGASLYVMPGLTWVTCPSCGANTPARDHLEVILDEARDWTARPKALAEALVALVDSEASVPRLYTRIRQWAHQGQLKPVYRMARDYEYDVTQQRFVLTDQPTGHARYRFGDVAARVLARNTPDEANAAKGRAS